MSLSYLFPKNFNFSWVVGGVKLTGPLTCPLTKYLHLWKLSQEHYLLTENTI